MTNPTLTPRESQVALRAVRGVYVIGLEHQPRVHAALREIEAKNA